MPSSGSFHDKAGMRFGRLLVLSRAGQTKARKTVWRCRCDCGKELEALSCNLASGNTASCGCLRSELNIETWTTHGHAAANTPEYQSWSAMMARVRSKTGRRYRDYGARGITVCERWLIFENFLADMGARPPRTSIDRIDNNGNYEPGNCRWATPSQQNANKRVLAAAS